MHDLSKLQEAEFLFRKAIEIKPNYVNAYSSLGIILRDLGKLQEAEISTRKAIEIKPDYAVAHSNLGSILRDVGKLQEAEVSTRKAIELDPKFPEHYNTLDGIFYALKVNIKDAIEIIPNILKDVGKSQSELKAMKS